MGPETATSIGLGAALIAGVLGAGVAWWMRRRTTLSIRNLYVAALLLLAAFAAVLAARWWAALLIVGPLVVFAASASLVGRRWRLSDLGAGEELRRFEQARRWICSRRRGARRASGSTSRRRERSSTNVRGRQASRTCR